jgi:beta-galactosidase
MNSLKSLLLSISTLLILTTFHTGCNTKWSVENSGRLNINFNKDWLFYRGNIAGDEAKEPAFADENWQHVRLPHAPKITPLRHPWRLPDNEDLSWYRKYFKLPERYRSKKIFIKFEAADKVTDVWINGTYLLKHVGPYLPFTVDITNHVKFGDDSNIIALKINNRDDRDIPGYGTWISYGGLYRDVHLIVTDHLHVTDAVYANKIAGGGIFVTYPVVSDSLAQIHVKTHILNEYDQTKSCKIITRLIDADNQVVSTVENETVLEAKADYSFIQVINLHNPKLWHPHHPHLYKLHSEILDKEKIVDQVETRIGVRRIQFSVENGFTINGEPFKFIGANRVQEYPYLAWAFSNSAQKRDALILKEGGFDYLRLSHNPQDPSFLDACDELGILVMDCIPGFQFIGGEKFRENSFQAMRKMIRRDRNHPSIILWELSLNETDFDSSYAHEAMRIGHEEFPGDQCFVAGWKFPDIYDVYLRATQHGARDYVGNTPLVISEYGHWDYGGGNSSSDVEHRDGEIRMLQQAKNHQESLNLNLGMPNLCGDGLWVSIDFQCYPSGILDYFRLPKFSYHFYRSQRDPNLKIVGIDGGPMVFIANYWTEQSVRPIKVYSNCDRVELFLNEESIKSQLPDTDSLSTNLPHPPFTFEDVPWKPGHLKAIGFIEGKQVASHSRITPGAAEEIDIRFGLIGDAIADGEDMFFIYASVVDSNGTVVPVNDREIRFDISGSGILLSPAKVTTEGGIASALVRTTDISGDIVITVESENLGLAVKKKRCINSSSM